MSDGGYWIDSPENPFNKMKWTQGGGGYDNAATHESNANREFAMQGAGAAALPIYANADVAQKVLGPLGGGYAMVGNRDGGGQSIIKVENGAPMNNGANQQPGLSAVVNGNAGGGPGAPASTPNGGGAGAGSQGVQTPGSKKTTGAGANAVLAPNGPLKTKKKDSITGLVLGGEWWQPNPWWSDTEEWEARYGEPGDWLGGVVTFGADVAWNAGGWIGGVITPTNNNPIYAQQPWHNNGWVSYDEGVSWEFGQKDGTPAFLWDNGGRNPDTSPWR